MKYNFKKLFFRVFLVFMVFGIMLTNCGFKGPLYLPQKPAASSVKTASDGAKTVVVDPQSFK